MKVIAIAAALCVSFAASAYAHPGGLNKEGCHNNRKTGDYHCHRPGAKPRQQPQELTGRVSVVDGDTLDLHGERIRLWGVDAPESAQPCLTSGKPWRCGQQAALALSDWIGQRTVSCAKRDQDRYGRIVATCQVGGADVGAWLVSNGWALDYRQYSSGAYARQESAAAAAKSGIWQGAFDKPWDWRRK